MTTTPLPRLEPTAALTPAATADGLGWSVLLDRQSIGTIHPSNGWYRFDGEHALLPVLTAATADALLQQIDALLAPAPLMPAV